MTQNKTARAAAVRAQIAFNINFVIHSAHDVSQIGCKQKPPHPSSSSSMVDAGDVESDDKTSATEEEWYIALSDDRQMPKRAASRAEDRTTGATGKTSRSRRSQQHSVSSGAGRVEEPAREGGQIPSVGPAHVPGN